MVKSSALGAWPRGERCGATPRGAPMGAGPVGPASAGIMRRNERMAESLAVRILSAASDLRRDMRVNELERRRLILGPELLLRPLATPVEGATALERRI